MTKKFQIVLLFIFSFISFLFGWFFAVFAVPGIDFNQKKALQAESEEAEIQSALEQIKSKMLFLFDLDELDKATKKNTLLETNKGYIQSESIDLKQKENLLKNPALDLEAKAKSFPETLPEEEHFPIMAPLSPQLKKIREDFFKKNKEQLLAIESQQKFFKSNGKYSFLVNVFSTQDEALEYFGKIKERYPLWSFLMKAYTDHIRIYLGPFASKELALEFKNNLSVPYSLDYLEEVSL